jgi:hypothetical protein
MSEAIKINAGRAPRERASKAPLAFTWLAIQPESRGDGTLHVLVGCTQLHNRMVIVASPAALGLRQVFRRRRPS